MEEPCASEDRERLLRPAPPASSFPRCSDRREMAVEMSQMPLADVAEAGTCCADGDVSCLQGSIRIPSDVLQSSAPADRLSPRAREPERATLTAGGVGERFQKEPHGGYRRGLG
jgi:hypothetical protein